MSSTASDLEDYRRSAREMLARIGCDVIGMETFATDSRDSLRTCLRHVEEADVYLGIIAHRYGTVPKGETRSFTEIEYDRAVELGLKIHCYLVRDSVSWSPRHMETGKKATALRRFKEKIKKAHTVRFFGDDLEEFRLDIIHYCSSHDDFTPRNDIGLATRRSVSVPRHPPLYAASRHFSHNAFVGRNQELVTLDEWVKSEHSVFILHAMGGQGKSSLAWKWLTERARQLVDGCAAAIWWGFPDNSVPAGSFARWALAKIRGLRIEDFDGIGRADIQQELLDELQQQPYVLALDGVEVLLERYQASLLDSGAQEVSPREFIAPSDRELFKGLVAVAPSKVLITTQTIPVCFEDAGLEASGVTIRSLDGLNEIDTVDLLRDLGVRGRVIVLRNLAKRYGNHPLIMRLIAGHVRSFREKPGDLGAWLASERGGAGLRLANLKDLGTHQAHLLNVSVTSLSRSARAVLGRFALFDGAMSLDDLCLVNPLLRMPGEKQAVGRVLPFERPRQGQVAVAVTSRKITDPSLAKVHLMDALKELNDWELLQWDRGVANRYDLHPIVREFARQELIEPLVSVGSDPSYEPYHQLIASHRFELAFQLYRGWLERGLRSIGSYQEVHDILRHFFPDEFRSRPNLSRVADQSLALNDMAVALAGMGLELAARSALALKLSVDLEEGDVGSLLSCLEGVAASHQAVGELAMARKYRDLATRVAGASGESAGSVAASYGLALSCLATGELETVQRLLDSVAGQLSEAGEHPEPTLVAALECWLDLYVGRGSLERWEERSRPVAVSSRRARLELLRVGAEIGLAEHAAERAGLSRASGLNEVWTRPLSDYATDDDWSRVMRVDAKQPVPNHTMPAHQEEQLSDENDPPRLVGVTGEWVRGRDGSAQDLGDALRGDDDRLHDEMYKSTQDDTDDVGSSGRSALADYAAMLAEDALELAKECGAPTGVFELLLARARVAQERHEEARSLVELAPPCIDTAEVYTALGEESLAKTHLAIAFEWAWADGPPFCFWWDLQRASVLLRRLGAVEPILEPFNAARVPPVLLEAEIESCCHRLEREVMAEQGNESTR